MKNTLKMFGPGFTSRKFILNTLCFADGDGEGGGGGGVAVDPAVEPPPTSEPAKPTSGEPQLDKKEGLGALGSLADGFAKLNNRELERLSRPGAGRVTIPAKGTVQEPAPEPPKPTGDAPVEKSASKTPAPEPVKKIDGLQDPESFKLEATKGKAVTESFQKVTNELKVAHGLIQKDRARIAELENALATKQTAWEEEKKKISGEVEQLRPFRAVTDEQNTPEFQAQYDKPIADAQKEMTVILKKVGIADDQFTKFLPNVAAMQNIATQLSEAGYKTEARQLETRIEKMADAQLKRENAIEDFKANHTKIVEGRKAELTAKQTQLAAKAKSHLESQWQAKNDKGEVKYPFFNEVKIAPDATEDQKKQANDYNDAVKGMREEMNKWLAIDTPEHKAELVLGTMIASVFSHQLKGANERIKSLEAELQKISKSAGAPRSPNPGRENDVTIPKGSSLVDGFRALNGRN